VRPKTYCTIENCGLPVVGQGMCSKHYARWSRTGDPSSASLIKKTQKGEPKKFLETALLQQTDECILWPYSCDNHGYAGMNIDNKTRKVHIIVCEKIHGEKPFQRAEAAHSCGNGHLGCINHRHLSWKSHSDNQMDRILHGTSNRGTQHGNHLLTEEDILKIKKLPHTNSEEVGARYGVAARTVRDIWNSKTWAWL